MTDLKLKRFDLLLVPDNPQHRVAPRAGEAWLKHLGVNRMLRPVREAVAEEWVELACEPDASSHELFTSGAAPDLGEPLFLQAVIRFGTKPAPLRFGEERESTFSLEIQGAVYDDLTGRLKARFKEIVAARPQLFVREHAGVSELTVVGEDEQPRAKRRRETGTALAGTRVEEW